MDLIELKNIAIEAALAAGKIIQDATNKEVKVEKKKGTSSMAAQVVTEVDKTCEKAILEYLLPTCRQFDFAMLTEETPDDGSRFQKDFFWCVDPMDGTLPFIQKRPGFAVSIALVAKNGTPQIGVVYDPSRRNLYHAVKGHGVFRNRLSWEISNKNNYLTYVTDRPLADTPRADEIKTLLHKNKAQFGLDAVQEIAGAGSVLNAMLVLENGPACMLKLPKKKNGGGSIWDYAATACIYQELRLTATNFLGGRLDLNKKDGTFMNHEGIFFSSSIKNSSYSGSNASRKKT